MRLATCAVSALMASTTELSLEAAVTLGMHRSRMTASIHPRNRKPDGRKRDQLLQRAGLEAIAPGTDGWR